MGTETDDSRGSMVDASGRGFMRRSPDSSHEAMRDQQNSAVPRCTSNSGALSARWEFEITT